MAVFGAKALVEAKGTPVGAPGTGGKNGLQPNLEGILYPG
jgi:hypothetical protein